MAEWQESLGNIFFGAEGNMAVFWMQILLILSLTFVISYLSYRSINHLESRLVRTRPVWNDALARAALKPMVVLVWVVGISFALLLILDYYQARHTSDAAYVLRNIVVTGIMTWFFFRAIREIEKSYLARKRKEKQVIDFAMVDAVGKIARVTVVVAAGLILLEALGFSLSGLIAFGGVGGIVAGLSAKDTLANFFGAMMVYFGRPFIVGDWIRSPDREIEGTVEKIGWRQTVIRTFDRRPIYVPNAAFTSIIVENASRMTYRRIKEFIGVRYADMGKVQRIVEDIETMLAKHKHINEGGDAPSIVGVDRFGPSSVEILLSCYTKAVDFEKFQAVKQSVLLKVARIIEKHKAEMAFSTTTVQLPPAAYPPESRPSRA
jgi:MscS family membrane protein